MYQKNSEYHYFFLERLRDVRNIKNFCSRHISVPVKIVKLLGKKNIIKIISQLCYIISSSRGGNEKITCYFLSDTFPVSRILIFILYWFKIETVLVADGFLHDVSVYRRKIMNIWGRSFGLILGLNLYGTGYCKRAIVYTHRDFKILKSRFSGELRVLKPSLVLDDNKYLANYSAHMTGVVLLFTSQLKRLTLVDQVMNFKKLLKVIPPNLRIYASFHPDFTAEQKDKVRSEMTNTEIIYEPLNKIFGKYDKMQLCIIGYQSFARYEFFGKYRAYIEFDIRNIQYRKRDMEFIDYINLDCIDDNTIEDFISKSGKKFYDNVKRNDDI